MGIHDSELAQTIWELGRDYKNPHEFFEAIRQSEINDFGFSEDFIFDLWGAISDARDGRLIQHQLSSSQQLNEHL